MSKASLEEGAMSPRRPNLFKPPARGSKKVYEPEAPIRPAEKEGDKPKLVGDTVSCRREIGTVGGVRKYCPYERKPGSKYCAKHQK